ncbi:helix-turn-helix domain-containing protein [Herbaspirillum sp. SJZ099]|uniref:helix-turn-helix domain-containing protein n=1 Tax=Herbaspirillum sp. SJZ099 TaxID=2572916 RepID=UPI0011A2EFE6|nr:helix-turn-helix transcriptional regulator [Herbaspirillum sp. SJZ099]TWC62357.1 transcriptional regulator with XRE-family HTH domain [Herbaspirillum sp. SJZ099]
MATTEKSVNRRIGKTIAHKRKAAGFTQEEVAEELGIGNEAFSRIERGLVSPGIYKLYVLADLFKCGVETFLVESSRRPSDQAEHIAQMLMKNSVVDRTVIVSIVEKLSKHMTRKTGGRKEVEEQEILL